MDADGNCLFRSVADQLYGEPEYHRHVRAKCYQYIRSERDLAERDSAVLRRKLSALEERVAEIAKQLLNALQSGAKEVAEREKKIIQMNSLHENKVKTLEKDKRHIREHFENKISLLEEEIDRQNSKLSDLRKQLKSNEEKHGDRISKDQDLTDQLVQRLSQMICAYEKKDADCSELKKKLVSIKYS